MDVWFFSFSLSYNRTRLFVLLLRWFQFGHWELPFPFDMSIPFVCCFVGALLYCHHKMPQAHLVCSTPAVPALEPATSPVGLPGHFKFPCWRLYLGPAALPGSGSFPYRHLPQWQSLTDPSSLPWHLPVMWLSVLVHKMGLITLPHGVCVRMTVKQFACLPYIVNK